MAARALASLLLVALPLLPAPARSHGGKRVVEVVAGPYIVSASLSRAGDQIDETIGLIDAASKDLVRNAAVTLTLERGDERRGPFLARPLENGYEARYPPPEGDGWTVLIEVQGDAGNAVVRHPYRPPGDGGIGGNHGLLLNVGLLLVLAAAVFLLPRIGRSRHTPSPKNPNAGAQSAAPDQSSGRDHQ